MRTPKIEALHRLINRINLKTNSTIPLLGIDKTPINDNSWLSGMLEADGNFYLNYKLNSNNLLGTLVYYLRLSQKQTYSRKSSNINFSNLPHMQLIADYFKKKVTIIEREKSSYIEKAYEVRTDNLESRNLLFDYLNKFPIFGYKHYAQLNLEKIHLLVISKNHRTIEGKDKLEKYSNLMKYDINKIYT
jgi:hypothetical protein